MKEINKSENIKPNFITIDNVKFFGEIGSNVKREEIETLMPSLGNEFYVLKHFKSIPGEERSRFLGKEIFIYGKNVIIDDNFIDNQLNTAGSKFNSEIDAFSSPEKSLALAKKYLLKKVKEGADLKWLIKGKVKDLVVSIDIDDEIKKEENIPLDKKIGTSPLVKIMPEIADKVIQEDRGRNDKYIVNKIKDMPAPETDRLIITLRWYPNQKAPNFNSLYPGEVSPAFPNQEKQTAEEEAFNKEYWDRHAFIENK